jgi:hypothetical protein
MCSPCRAVTYWTPTGDLSLTDPTGLAFRSRLTSIKRLRLVPTHFPAVLVLRRGLGVTPGGKKRMSADSNAIVTPGCAFVAAKGGEFFVRCSFNADTWDGLLS